MSHSGTTAKTPAAVHPLRRRVFGAWITGLLLLLVLVLLVRHTAEERRFGELVLHVQPVWLAAVLLLQATTYVCAAAVWQRALRHADVRVRLLRLVPLGLAKLFTDQTVPSAGMSGTLLVVRALVRRGVPRGLAVGAMLAGLVAFYVAYAVAVAASLAVLWSRGEITPALLAVTTVFSLVAASVPLAILWLNRRARERAPRWLRSLRGGRELLAALAEVPAGRVTSPRLVTETAALQFAIFLLDAATLALVLRAVGSPETFPVVFASFVVASAVSTLAWVPGGLGTFEGTCIAMLHVHGVPLETALAATLLLRGFTFWLPMLPGLALARHEMLGEPQGGSHSETG
jgi:uncharacterized protein (TIRG00374 family)